VVLKGVLNTSATGNCKAVLSNTTDVNNGFPNSGLYWYRVKDMSFGVSDSQHIEINEVDQNYTNSVISFSLKNTTAFRIGSKFP
jgi:hypothetical protein